MSEKMILIPYSEYQELVNRPDNYKAFKILERAEFWLGEMEVCRRFMTDPTNPLKTTEYYSREVMDIFQVLLSDIKEIASEYSEGMDKERRE